MTERTRLTGLISSFYGINGAFKHIFS
jgi:hypothetical protein